jgi:hypothetical protein
MSAASRLSRAVSASNMLSFGPPWRNNIMNQSLEPRQRPALRSPSNTISSDPSPWHAFARTKPNQDSSERRFTLAV